MEKNIEQKLKLQSDTARSSTQSLELRPEKSCFELNRHVLPFIEDFAKEQIKNVNSGLHSLPFRSTPVEISRLQRMLIFYDIRT